MDEPPGVRFRDRADRRHDGRVFPRREGRRRAALHRQHLPLHAGRLRGLGAARPHAVGRRLPARRSATEMGAARRAHHLDPQTVRSPRCRRCTFRPTITPTRPLPRRSAHLDATTALSRQISELGIYPAVDPLASTSRILDPADRRRGALPRRARRARDAAALPRPPGHHRDSRASKSFPTTTRRSSAARAACRICSRSRSSSPSSSPDAPART